MEISEKLYRAMNLAAALKLLAQGGRGTEHDDAIEQLATEVDAAVGDLGDDLTKRVREGLFRSEDPETTGIKSCSVNPDPARREPDADVAKWQQIDRLLEPPHRCVLGIKALVDALLQGEPTSTTVDAMGFLFAVKNQLDLLEDLVDPIGSSLADAVGKQPSLAALELARRMARIANTAPAEFAELVDRIIRLTNGPTAAELVAVGVAVAAAANTEFEISQQSAAEAGGSDLEVERLRKLLHSLVDEAYGLREQEGGAA